MNAGSNREVRPIPIVAELQGVRGRIALHVWCSDQPRFVVLIAHGHGEHAARYQHLAEVLVAEGAAVYAPDHIGHGRSDGERVVIDSFGDLLEDMRRVSEHARGKHPEMPLVLIGHSMGGLIAARYAQLHRPELTALVLSAPALGGEEGLEGLLAIDPFPEVPIDSQVLSRDPEVVRAYDEDPLVWHGPFRRPTIASMFAAMRDVSSGPNLGTLPTLWMHGAADQLTPLELARSVFEKVSGDRFESVVYPDARHEIFNEINRDEVVAAVVDFLHRVV